MLFCLILFIAAYATISKINVIDIAEQVSNEHLTLIIFKSFICILSLNIYTFKALQQCAGIGLRSLVSCQILPISFYFQHQKMSSNFRRLPTETNI